MTPPSATGSWFGSSTQLLVSRPTSSDDERVRWPHPRTAIVAAGQRAGTTRAGVLLIGHVVSPVQRWLYRRGGGRLSPEPTAGHLPSRPSGEFTIDQAIGIPRPAETVYAFLADIQDAEPIPRRATVQMVKQPPGRTTLGTRWHERVRFGPGCWLRIESVVTEVDEPRRLGMDFSSRPWSGHLTYDIDDDPDGCVLHHRELVRVHALLRPLGPVIERRLRRTIGERLGDIEHVLTSRTS